MKVCQRLASHVTTGMQDANGHYNALHKQMCLPPPPTHTHTLISIFLYKQ